MDQAIWPTHFKSAVDHGHKDSRNDHDHAMRPTLHCTAREEIKLVMQWKKEMFHRAGEKGYGKIKLHHLHCHSELPLLETVTLINFTPCEVLYA